MKAKEILLWVVVCILIFVSCTKNDMPQPSSKTVSQLDTLIPDCSGGFMAANGASPDTIFNFLEVTCNFGDTCHFSRNADTLYLYSSIVLHPCFPQIVVINEKSDTLFITMPQKYIISGGCDLSVKTNFGIKIPKANNFNVCILNGVLYQGF